MFFRILSVSALVCSLMLSGTVALAADKVQAQDGPQTQAKPRAQGWIYGNELMTEQERAEFRNKLRALKTKEERKAYRLEHRKKMQARAKEKGVKLQDAPKAKGKRPASSPSSGGMGPGGRK